MPCVFFRANPDPATQHRDPIIALVCMDLAYPEALRRQTKQRRRFRRWLEQRLQRSLLGLPYWGHEGLQWGLIERAPGANLLEGLYHLRNEVYRMQLASPTTARVPRHRRFVRLLRRQGYGR